jgi:hypothetical protein
LKRRKFAPAAIFLAGLLLAAVAAASVGAATSSPSQATSPAAAPAGKVVNFTKHATVKPLGVRSFPAAAAKALPKPNKASMSVAINKAVKAQKLANRPMPPALATKAKKPSFQQPSFQLRSAAVAFPQTTSLPIVSHFSGLAVNGLNAFDQAAVGGYELTPYSTTICANPTFTLQAVNNVMRIYDATTLHPVSSALPLELFFSPALVQTGFDTLTDPKCYYDQDTRHWFLTESLYDSVNTSGSAVVIATSVTDNPVGPWNVYVLDTTFDGTTCSPGPVGPACLADQPLLGANKDAIFISTNSFDLNGPAFNGTQMYILDKSQLAFGSPSVNTVYADIGANFATPEGTIPPPIGPIPNPGCGLATSIFCWYSIQPALTPNSVYTTDRGGTEFAMSALDWFFSTDDRVALWAITGTTTINQVFPSIGIQYAIFQGQSYGFPGTSGSAQREGPTPFGDFFFGPPSPGATPLGTGDDRMNEVKFVKTRTNAYVIGGVNTIIKVPNAFGQLNQRVGIAYWMLQPLWAGPFLVGASAYVGSTSNPGYIANAFEDVMYPAPALGPQALGATIGYTLNGHEYYPTAALSKIKPPTWKAPNIQIAKLGQGPNDDFCQYGLCPTPRWGDYSGAAANNSLRYLSIGMIQSSCDITTYIFDPSCGGTRALQTNWGTAVVRTSD